MADRKIGGCLRTVVFSAAFTVALGGFAQQPGGGYAQQGGQQPGYFNNGGQIQGQIVGPRGNEVQYQGQRNGNGQFQVQGQIQPGSGQVAGGGGGRIAPPPPLNLQSRLLQPLQLETIKQLKLLNQSALKINLLLTNSSRFTYPNETIASLYAADPYLQQMGVLIGNNPSNAVFWARALESRAKLTKDTYLDYLAYYVQCHGTGGRCGSEGKQMKLSMYLDSISALRSLYTDLEANVRSAQIVLSQTYLVQNAPYSGQLYQNEQIGVLTLVVQLEQARAQADEAICFLLSVPAYAQRNAGGQFVFDPNVGKHKPGIFCPRCYKQQYNLNLPANAMAMENSYWLQAEARLMPAPYFPVVTDNQGQQSFTPIPVLYANFAPQGYVSPQVNLSQQQGQQAPAQAPQQDSEFTPIGQQQPMQQGGQAQPAQMQPSQAAPAPLQPQAPAGMGAQPLPGQGAPQGQTVPAPPVPQGGFVPAASSVTTQTNTVPAQGSPGLLSSPASGATPPAYYNGGGQPQNSTPQITPTAPAGVSGNMGFAPAGGPGK